MIEIIRALAVVADGTGPEHAAVADALGIPAPSAADHTALFVGQLFPYASVYLGPEGQIGGVACDRVAGFLRALGYTPPPEPDHLVVLLAAYAAILERERDTCDDANNGANAVWTRARETLLVEHLLSWLPIFLGRVLDIRTDAYREWALQLDDVLATEAARSPAAARLLSAHLIHAPALPDPREHGTREFVDALLSPVRTGAIATASDLGRMAEELGLGRRVGGRRCAAFSTRIPLASSPGSHHGRQTPPAHGERTG